jgi:hypothetical protein
MGLRYSSGMTRFVLPALVVLALMAGSPASSATRIEFSPPLPDAGTRLRVRVDAEWPEGCAPTLESARVEGSDIVLTSRIPPGVCDGSNRGYTLETERLEGNSLKLTRNGVYRIRHEVLRTAGGEPELHGFRLLHVGNSPDAGFVPESGFWWPERGGDFDRAGPGIGAQMEAQARTLSLSLFGYAADGNPDWYIGAGPISGLTAQLELNRLEGGAGPFDAYRAPAQSLSIGAAHVEMLSPSRITLWLVRATGRGSELQLQAVSMVRFRFAQEPAEAWLGRWVVLAESDDNYPTRRIDFTAIERNEDGFALTDAGAAHRLACRTSATQPNSPPRSCVLSVAQAGNEVIEFRDIALNELRGWSSSSLRIVALKLNR